MPSILYSTSCYIKNDSYRLRIYIDDQKINSNNNQSNDIDLDFTPTEIQANHVLPSSTQLKFELLDNKKPNVHVPKFIELNHVFNVKQTVPSKNKILSSNPQTTSSETFNSNTYATTISTTGSQETSTTSRSSNGSQDVPLKQTQFSFTRFLSSLSNSDKNPMPLHKTLIKIKYIDVSNAIHWNIKHLELQMDTEDVAYELYANINLCLSTLKKRPRSLLVFVNPLSGKGQARLVYHRKILSLFEEANITVNTIYTERANHARDYLINDDLTRYDGLVCVGGDGMFAELCHGILLRTARDKNLDIDNPRVTLTRPNMRIGVIPAGSTDALVFGTTGLNDPVTSALQIIVGESLSIDIATVHNENGFVRFMATMLAYGFFGDIIYHSDRWRCLGPLRYDLAGFLQFIRNKSYHSELSITLSQHDSSNISHSESQSSSGSLNGALTIVPDIQPLINSAATSQPRRNSFNKSASAINRIVSPIFKFCSRNCEKCAEENIDSKQLNTPLQIKREGRYTTINCLNMPCRCAKSKYGMSPYVHLGDGTFDLILVKRSWRTGFLRFLWQVANDGRTIQDLPNVERYRVSEVLIRPIVTNRNTTGNWACDGELIHGKEVQVRVHRQILNLFASGIKFDERQNQEDVQMKSTSVFNCFRNNKKYQMSQEFNSGLTQI